MRLLELQKCSACAIFNRFIIGANWQNVPRSWRRVYVSRAHVRLLLREHLKTSGDIPLFFFRDDIHEVPEGYKPISIGMIS